jgi:hypothetical protein
VDLRYHLGGVSKATTPPSTRSGQEILNEAHTDTVAHPLQLSVDLNIVIVVVLTQLGDNGAICQCDQFRIYLLDAGPNSRKDVRRVPDVIETENRNATHFHILRKEVSARIVCGLEMHHLLLA